MNPTTNKPSKCPECDGTVFFSIGEPLWECGNFECRLIFTVATVTTDENRYIAKAPYHRLTRYVLGNFYDADPEEFTVERLQRLAPLIERVIKGQDAATYWQLASDAPDFAGGTCFTSEDVAHALYHPNSDLGLGAELTEEELASVTHEQLRQSQKTIESYIFEGSYSWIEALRDNLSDVPPAPDEDEEEDARCEFCGDMRGDREGTLCADCLEKVEEHENDGHEKYEDVTCPACRGVA